MDNAATTTTTAVDVKENLTVVQRIKKVCHYLNEKKMRLIMLLYVWITPISMAMASSGTGGGGGTTSSKEADEKWNSFIEFIMPWISRLGGLVILIGAIDFGLAFKNEDADGKTRGIRTVIAGCIVFAVGIAGDVFLAD